MKRRTDDKDRIRIVYSTMKWEMIYDLEKTIVKNEIQTIKIFFSF